MTVSLFFIFPIEKMTYTVNDNVLKKCGYWALLRENIGSPQIRSSLKSSPISKLECGLVIVSKNLNIRSSVLILLIQPLELGDAYA